MVLLDTRHVLDLLRRNDPDAAIDLLEEAIDAAPRFLAAHVLLAYAYELDAQWDAAMEAWMQVCFFVPNSPAARKGIRRVIGARHAAAQNAPAANALPPLLETVEASGSAASGGSGAPDAAPPTSSNIDDLDHLIQELESARIDPDPDPDAAATPDLEDDVDDMVSETLARIYASQQQYEQAAQVYLRLANQNPAEEQRLLQQAAEMRERARSQHE